MKFLPLRIQFFFGDREYQPQPISESAHVLILAAARICFTPTFLLPPELLIVMDFWEIYEFNTVT
jgi:hypothetical protein